MNKAPMHRRRTAFHAMLSIRNRRSFDNNRIVSGLPTIRTESRLLFPDNPLFWTPTGKSWGATFMRLRFNLFGLQANHEGALPQTRAGRLLFAFPSILPYHELVSCLVLSISWVAL